MTAFDALLEHLGASAGMGDLGQHLVRLIVASVAGGIVGFEREVRGRQAGWRTHMLVAVGSALVMIVSSAVATVDWPEGSKIQVDPARIAYGVMTGIGFLGAGVIVKQGMAIRGLTTAASLWCSAAVGLGAGLGLHGLALVSALLLLLVLWALNLVERLLPKPLYRCLTVRCPWGKDCVRAIVALAEQRGVRVHNASFVRSDDLGSADISVHISYKRPETYEALERELMVGVESYDLIATTEIEN